MQENLKKEIEEKMAAMQAAAPTHNFRGDAAQMTSYLENLEARGVDVEALVHSTDFRRLANGQLTENLYDVVEQKGENTYNNKAKFYISKDGNLSHITRFEPRNGEKVDRSQFRGHVFTPEERANLYANGNAGTLIEMDTNFGKEGMAPNVVPCFVSFDHKLNRFKCIEAAKISDKVFEKLYGQPLNEKQVADLKAGKPVLATTTARDGSERKVMLQFNAYELGLQTVPAMFFAQEKFMGAELTREQREALGAGKEVKLEGLTRTDKKTGQSTVFSATVRLNENGRMEFVPKERQEQAQELSKPIKKDQTLEKPKPAHKMSM